MIVIGTAEMRDDHGGGEVVEVEHPLDERGEDEQDEAERGRGAVGDAQDRVLDLARRAAAPRRCVERRSPAGRGRRR